MFYLSLIQIVLHAYAYSSQFFCTFGQSPAQFLEKYIQQSRGIKIVLLIKLQLTLEACCHIQFKGLSILDENFK